MVLDLLLIGHGSPVSAQRGGEQHGPPSGPGAAGSWASGGDWEAVT